MSYTNAADTSPAVVARAARDRQQLAKAETEDFLRAASAIWIERRNERLWHRDYSSVEAYARSVEPNRLRWQAAVGNAADLGFPPATGPIVRAPFLSDRDVEAHWLTVPVAQGLNARAALALPKERSGPFPLVIAQHGISSSPERVMGFDDNEGLYHAYGRALVRSGFAVLAPLHVTGVEPRGRLQRMCLMLGITLWGLEIYKLQRLLDAVLTLPEIDGQRIGMWGISLGGAYTLFTLPLEPRIRAGICTAWFNDRYRKMIIDDPRYSCFLSTREEHIFVPRWLVEFDDADLVSLICPRPFQIQTGKGDGIAWWPFVVEAFQRSKEHYDRLGYGTAIELDLHEGGHEIRVERGLAFLQAHL